MDSLTANFSLNAVHSLFSPDCIFQAKSGDVVKNYTEDFFKVSCKSEKITSIEIVKG